MIKKLTDAVESLLPMAVARIVLGIMWLASLLWKLPPDFAPGGEEPGLHGWLSLEVEHPTFGFYGDFIESVVLPNFVLFAWLVFLAELAVGLALVSGVFARPAALLGLLMSINLWIGLKNVPGEWHWTYGLMTMWHAAVLLSPTTSQWSLSKFLNGLGEDTRSFASSGRGSIAAAILRVGLGVVTLDTWRGTIKNDFYDGESLAGFFDWVKKPAEEGGNGSTLGFVHSLIDATIVQAPEFFGWIFTIVELCIGVGLIFGLFTRAASLAAIGFFGMLFLTYFGGEEWIGIYVLLAMAAVMTFVHWGGRKFGLDQLIAKGNNESPAGLVW